MPLENLCEKKTVSNVVSISLKFMFSLVSDMELLIDSRSTEFFFVKSIYKQINDALQLSLAYYRDNMSIS